MNGIQRSSFIPCIKLVKSSMEVINLTAAEDYRTARTQSVEGMDDDDDDCFVSPVNEGNSRILETKFDNLCEGSIDSNISLPVFGRAIRIPSGRLSVAAKFDFADLFVENRSAVDYIGIFTKFPNVFVMKIPKLDESMRNEIRRIITFIDEAYEKRVCLV